MPQDHSLVHDFSEVFLFGTSLLVPIFIIRDCLAVGFLGGLVGKESACNAREQETWIQSLGQEDPLKEDMATHSSILAWRIPWAEEPGGLQSTGFQRVRHD